MRNYFDPFFDIDFNNIIPERFFTFENEKVQRYPLTNIGRDNDKNLIVEIACAGFDKSELTIETEENMIVIKGHHVESENKVTYIQNHISTSDFTRKIYMVPLYVGGEISAAYKDGILTLVVKPNEERKPKQIEIKQSQSNLLTNAKVEEVEETDPEEVKVSKKSKK